MAGNFADLTAVLTLDSARFSEDAARGKHGPVAPIAVSAVTSGRGSHAPRRHRGSGAPVPGRRAT
ncbi:hypothetical protein ACI1VO_31030, partial [Escherichia coli]|uniref:hypothetical protein n=1 Tax=Escherichia coli TaxID=562 RepID=UPI00384F120E